MQKVLLMILKTKNIRIIGITWSQSYQYRSDVFDFVQESRHTVVTTDISTCLFVTFATRTVRQKQKLSREKHCIHTPDVRAVARVEVKTHRVSMWFLYLA